MWCSEEHENEECLEQDGLEQDDGVADSDGFENLLAKFKRSG